MKNRTHSLLGAEAGWIARMAWRDSRGKRLLLLLFTSSVIFGIGAIVAIHSLRENLQRIVEEQTRTLLGADVILETRQPPSPQLEAFTHTLPGNKVREMRFRSMAVFPGPGESRFVQVRAIDGPLPFYGRMETDPMGPDEARMPGPGKAIIEESLLLQMDLSPGDPIRLGEKTYTIEAALIRMAGESEVTGFFAPRIYIPLEGVEETGLIQQGSIIRYRTIIATSEEHLPVLKESIRENRGTFFVDESVRVETVEGRRRSLERVLNNLLDFLNLIGFIALLLGGVGIIGAVNVYLLGKRDTIAILRCLGTSSRTAFSIYLGQILAFGMFGALIGTGLGIGIQFVIPVLLASFLPFPVDMHLSPSAIATGLVFGWLVVGSSALIPLLGIRNVSPLRAIRASIEPPRRALKDPFVWIAGGVLFATLMIFTFHQSRRPEIALAFVGGLIAALGILAFLAWALRATLKRFQSPSSPYAYRMALSNLFRPNNRTLLLITTLGMGVLMVNTLLQVREGLLDQVNIESMEDAANVILLDVQPDQKDELVRFLTEEELPPHDLLPVVTMRVAAIKGRTMREWRAMENSPVSRWITTWEFRNTYRDHVLDNAEVVSGEFVAVHDGTEPFPVSLSENVVDDMGVGIGDSITWDVQGVEIQSVVSSIRQVNWQAGRQNFNVVFPLNTIEEAPTVYAISVRTPDRIETARLQNALMPRFPNISLIDLSLIFASVEEILGKAGFVINFMAGFTIATGLVVLAGAILGSRYQRLQESVLFRTLGASKRFIQTVLTLEFILLGTVAGLAGILLSWIAAWALLTHVFNIAFQLQLLSSLFVLVAVAALTWLTGWLTSRGIAGQPPLVILRKE